MTKKMLFIFNPHSGKGQIKNHLLVFSINLPKPNMILQSVRLKNVWTHIII